MLSCTIGISTIIQTLTNAHTAGPNNNATWHMHMQAYLYSLRFTSPSSAQVAVSAINFLLGFMFVVGSQTMQGIPEAQVGMQARMLYTEMNGCGL